MKIFTSILDWEPIAGYPIKDFDWILAIYILGIATLAVTLFYFFFVFIGKHKNGWKKMKVPFIISISVVLAISCIGAPVLSTSWEALKQALVKETKGGGNDSESAKLAIGESKENVATLEAEGAVLLQNRDNVLPLDKTINKKINLFGASVFGMLYGGGGSGVFITNNTYNGNDFHATRLEDALEAEGFEYNMDLYNLTANYYDKHSYSLKTSNYDISCQNNAFPGNTLVNGEYLVDPTCFPYDNEPEVSAYTQTYSELGGKTLLESAKEYSDTAIFAISRAGSEDGDLNLNLCRLTDREKAMIELLRTNFSKFIFIINSANPMELGDLDKEGVDSVLWVGHPGLTGNKAVAGIISGRINPSGKMADTWAYKINEAPSFQSFGPDTTVTSGKLGKSIVEYMEGIYVGYRYYTTRAATDMTFIYDDQVQYSFGEGYSYTTFDKWISDSTVDLENNTVSVQVGVTNTGTVSGKEVVELYLTAPYKPGGIEKSYVELVGFAKTNELQPGETFYARINIELEQFASWDTTAGNYILEAGDYQVTLRDDCWNLTEVGEGETNTINFKYEQDVRFLKGKGGGEYSNKFADAEYGPHTNKIVYLSRNDWANTFPQTSNIKVNDISDAAKNAIANPSYTKDNLLTTEFDTTVGKAAGITMRDMMNATWDDPRWPDFISQLSKQELIDLIDNGGFQTEAIESIQKRGTYDDDGPASIQIKGTGYTGEVAIASTWNTDAAQLMGRSIGKEGAAMGLTGWYAPGLNIHRCPTGGRNFEYYSEDPLLSGMMGGYVAKGTAEFGVYTYAKHIALNEQEQNRQNLTVWANEQSIRQIYLRAYEVYVYEGGLGFMSSFSRIGSVWSGAHGFLNTVCRDEWGFHGVVITDWINPSLMPVNAGLRGGNDLWLMKNTTSGATKASSETPKDGIVLLKRAAKNILYVCAQSNCCWTVEEYAAKGVDVDFSKMGYDVF